MRLKKNVLESPYRKIKLKPALRYASSNKGTPALLRTTLLLVCLSIATTPYRKITAAYALNYLKLQFLSANMIALIGTVLYNAIKEYYNDGIRKTIYFYSYTIETIHANYIKNSRSNVTVLDDYYDNNVNNILIKYIDNKRQRYNILIEDYNCAGKREDNILTIDECRTSYSNKKDIEANEREEETRVRLRELLEKIYDILLREFRRANNFIESITYNDDEQELELEDCDALVERYKEEINCSDLYSTM
ncbi:hypothetical protein HBH98_108090 [Parastagonospora nodorum]|nr:hypothetical protein HBH98_108090 [Parastagonospora nodorum]KAH4376901.1 hypothetical protein HBH97_115100 [Parastagonospora nodorum]KAH4397045.1 hypothetical protein HBH99_115400 [Parastagonospora nodorum]